MARITEKKSFKTKSYHVILVKFCWPAIILIALIFFLAEYFLIIRPRVAQTVNGGPLDVKGYEQILEEQKSYLEKLKQFKVEADKMNKDDLKKLNYVLAEKIELPTILNQVDVLSKQSGMELTGFSVSFGGGVITTSLNLKDGTYQAVKQYLDLVERNIRVMDVTNISLQDIGNTVSLTIKSYYLGG